MTSSECRQHYLTIFCAMEERGIFVYDSALRGPGVAINMSFKGSSKRVICIDGRLSWKRKLFVLLHEVGHLFKYNGYSLTVRKINSSEIEANKTAINLLKILAKKPSPNLYLQYARFYNSMNKANSNSKAHLFLLL